MTEPGPGPAPRWAALRRFVRARLDRSSELGLRLTINVVLFAGAIWLFGGLLDAVLDNATLVRWDRAVNHWFALHATPAAQHGFTIVTRLGTPGAWIVVAAAALWLAWRRQWLLLWAWVTINLGGGVVQYALKVSVHRTRPLDAAAFLKNRSYSFPSGHTMDATITYVLLAFVIGTVYDLPPARQVGLYLAATGIIVLVGFSRIYLGVHYPSDVFGGFAAGVAWLTAGLATVHVVRTRRASS